MSTQSDKSSEKGHEILCVSAGRMFLHVWELWQISCLWFSFCSWKGYLLHQLSCFFAKCYLPCVKAYSSACSDATDQGSTLQPLFLNTLQRRVSQTRWRTGMHPVLLQLLASNLQLRDGEGSWGFLSPSGTFGKEHLGAQRNQWEYLHPERSLLSFLVPDLRECVLSKVLNWWASKDLNKSWFSTC